VFLQKFLHRRKNKIIPLIQFWDKPVPPEEVNILLDTWRNASGFAHQLYNLNTADQFIKEQFDERTLKAFRTCAVPAMQADFFRYCALYILGGLYIDADVKRISDDVAQFFNPSKRGILVLKQNRIANDVLFFAKPADPLLKRVIAIAINNIEQRKPSGVWAVTGPGIMTSLYNTQTEKSAFDGFQIEPISKVKNYVLYQWEMDYKKEETDWRDFGSGNKMSIFRDETDHS